MTVRTTRVDLSAIIRSTPILKSRIGGAGSFGLGLAPGITGFEFNVTQPLTDGVDSNGVVATFKVDQADAVYTLIDDGAGRFSLYEDVPGEVYIDDDGYAYILHEPITTPSLDDGEYGLTIGVTLGLTTAEYIRAVPVEAAPPADYIYEITPTNTSFNADAADGEGVTDLVSTDNRLTITNIELLDDAGGRFRVVNNVNVVRTAVAVEAEVPYDLLANVTFSDSTVFPDYTFTLEAFSIG